MHRENNHDTQSIDAEDMSLLGEVIAVCEDGRQLYQHVAEHVADQQSRNVFTGMAAVRAEIVSELEAEAENRLDESQTSGTMVGTLRQWYVDAIGKFKDEKELAFIEQIEANEKRSLSVLKKAVKNLKNRTLSKRLSSLTASFQMSLDRMKLLKETYK